MSLAQACRLVVAAALVPCCEVAADESNAEVPAGETVFLIAPYLWTPHIKGNVGLADTPVGSLTLPVDVNFLDYGKALNVAVLLMTEVRRDRWGLAVDGVWMQLEDEATPQNQFLSTVDIQLDTVLVSAAPFYRFLDTPRVSGEVLAGGRYVYVRQDLDLSPDFGAVDTISGQIVGTATERLADEVGRAVNRAKDEIGASIVPGRDQAGRVRDAVEAVEIDLDGSAAADALAGREAPYTGDALRAEEVAYANAVQEAVAERAADLVDGLSPAERRDPAAVERAIAKAAAEPVDSLKKSVSAEARRAIEQAEDQLSEKIAGGMTKAASAPATVDRAWVDPFVGLRFRTELGDRFGLVAYGDIGGFGAGSDLTWQVFGGLSWQASLRTTIEAGYRHLDIDYDEDGFVFDVSMGGFVAGVSFRI